MEGQARMITAVFLFLIALFAAHIAASKLVFKR